jgi:LPXTG-motif cell wall-anchored protein
MTYRCLRAVLVVGVAVAVLVVGPGAPVAHAQEAVVPTLTSANVSPGGGDDISGGGCAARVSVQVQFDGAVLVTTASTATGSYGAHLIIPVSAVPGSHKITVVCAALSGQVSNSTTVGVELPRTGVDVLPVIAVGCLSILVGGALVLISRRRRTA